LQALLDKNSAQSTSELVIELNIDRATVIKRLHEIGKIQDSKKENGFHISYRKMLL